MNKIELGFLGLSCLNLEEAQGMDQAALERMMDRFLDRGGRHFDTAYTCLNGGREETIRWTLVERYHRYF